MLVAHGCLPRPAASLMYVVRTVRHRIASRPPRICPPDVRTPLVSQSSALLPCAARNSKQVLEERNFPASDIVLLERASALAGTLTEAAGEPTFIRALWKDSFEDARFVFFAGAPHDAEQSWSAAQRSGATVIDLTGALATPGQRPARARGFQRWGLAVSAAPTPIKAADAFPTRRIPRPRRRRDRRVHARSRLATIRAAANRAAAVPSGFRARTARRGGTGEPDHALAFVSRPSRKPVFDAQVAFQPVGQLRAGSAKPTLAEMRRRDRARCGCLSRRRRADARHSVGASAGLLRVCFRGLRGVCVRRWRAEQLHARFENLGVKIAAPEDAAPSNATVAGESEIHLARIEAGPECSGRRVDLGRC